jgi:hypothetical protein
MPARTVTRRGAGAGGTTVSVPGAEGLVLCKFSRSEILQNQILHLCPLKLNHSQHNHCPCKRRRYHVTQFDLRVSECLYPNTFQNEVIRNPEAFRVNLVKSIEGRKAREKEGKPSMTTAVAEPKGSAGAGAGANGVKRETRPAADAGSSTQQSVQQPAQVVDDRGGLWCGVRIPILGVAGEKGSGKSLFVSSIDPAHTAMIDLEDSTASYNIPFAKRWNLYDEMAKKDGKVPKPIECFLWFRDLITDGIKPGEFTVLAVDPISDIEQGMVDWVQENPQYFGHTKAQYEKGGGIMWGDVKSYWKMLLGIVSTKVETFAFTVHMGAVFKGSQPVEGKRKPKGKETLTELASIFMLLERNPDENGKVPDKPSGRIAPRPYKSRLAKTTISSDGDVVHVPLLPPMLSVATPKEIRRYILNPPDYAKLKKSEYAPPEKMSDEDKLLIEAEIAENNRITAETNLTRMEQMRRAAEEQTRLKQEREVQQAAAVAQAECGHEIVGAAETAKSDLLGDLKESGDRADLAKLCAEINRLFSALQMTGDQMAAALGKRGVKHVAELSLEQADELRGKLVEVINKREAAAKAAGAESGN